MTIDGHAVSGGDLVKSAGINTMTSDWREHITVPLPPPDRITPMTPDERREFIAQYRYRCERNFVRQVYRSVYGDVEGDLLFEQRLAEARDDD